MERLTTNKNVSEMGMFKLALNCCYITQDGNTRYRDYANGNHCLTESAVLDSGKRETAGRAGRK